jgi:hypothetical protein
LRTDLGARAEVDIIFAAAFVTAYEAAFAAAFPVLFAGWKGWVIAPCWAQKKPPRRTAISPGSV